MTDRSCCTTGFRWEGTPAGKESTIKDTKTYITGDNKEVAVVVFHDAFGWTLNNPRLLADHFAEEVGATAYVPDFFHGTGLPEDGLSISRDGDDFKIEQKPGTDLGAWAEINKFEKRKDDIVSVLRELRKTYTKIGAVGYCWGGATLMNLAGKSFDNVLDCVTIAHPGPFSQQAVEAVSIPVQILAPEKDFTFTQELKDMVQKIVPTLGVPYDYQHFHNVPHGFASRCDTNDEIGRKSLERAKNATVYWLQTFLK